MLGKSPCQRDGPGEHQRPHGRRAAVMVLWGKEFPTKQRSQGSHFDGVSERCCTIMVFKDTCVPPTFCGECRWDSESACDQGRRTGMRLRPVLLLYGVHGSATLFLRWTSRFILASVEGKWAVEHKKPFTSFIYLTCLSQLGCLQRKEG